MVEPLPSDGTDPLRNYWTIREELKQYNDDLAERPELIAVSKAELPGAQLLQQQLQQALGKEVLLFSSVTGQGLNKLMRHTYTLLNPADA